MDLMVAKGEKIAITGPSGSGKTTLLNLIGTLDYPEQGKIFFDGKDLTGYSNTELAVFRNENLGFIFQYHHLMPQLTLLENVMLPLLPRGKSVMNKEKSWAEYLIQNVGIWEQRNQKPSQLSGGECQRTAVVRALVNKPQLLLADEPTGALDEENAVILSELLLKLSIEEGVTLLTVTHDATLANKMDKKYTLRNGKLI
jgi:ABC-type lipoprotein export system ATPase subunit